MKFILTCGGTAGHINPALAVAGRLKELMPDSRVPVFGSRGQDGDGSGAPGGL
ncbi:MAG: glycosyltransferase [Oscillospiraceae bacterium]